MHEEKTPNARLIAAVLHGLLRREKFTRYADLKDALATACAKKSIPYRSSAISEAITLVEFSKPVLHP